MKANGSLSLILKAPNVVEKASPGEKRILSVMVLDTLVLADGNSEDWFEKGKRCMKAGNLTEALMWWHKAAEQGNARAESQFGKCLEYGIGIDQNKAEAEFWYNRSAIHGNRNDTWILGILRWDSGRYIEAYKWFSIAIELGEGQAVERLKHMLNLMPANDILEGEKLVQEFNALKSRR